jgi:hypothetical protein
MLSDRPDIKYVSPPSTDNGQAKKRRVKSRRFAMINYFNDHVKRHLKKPSTVLVWLSLWRHADSDNTVEISVRQIAEECGLTYRGAQKAIGKLIESKLVRRIRGGQRDHSTAVYRLRLDVDHWSNKPLENPKES